MWQDKNDTCLIVRDDEQTKRQRKRAGERRRAETTEKGTWRASDRRTIRGPIKMHGTSSALIPIAGALSNARYLPGEHLHAAALNHCRNIVRSRVSHGGPHLRVLLPRKMNGRARIESRFIAISKRATLGVRVEESRGSEPSIRIHLEDLARSYLRSEWHRAR